jgi:HSP20 family molecular chaperone IbpA
MNGEVIVEIAVPSVMAKDLTTPVFEGAATVSGETKPENREQQGQTYVEEIVEGRFQRAFGLPVHWDGDQT